MSAKTPVENLVQNLVHLEYSSSFLGYAFVLL